MNDQLISFDTAKLAKEKGFNIVCYDNGNERSYDEDGEVVYGSVKSWDDSKCPAPTQSLLQTWLREKKSTAISITTGANIDPEGNHTYTYQGGVMIMKDKYYEHGDIKNKQSDDFQAFFKTYEEALEAGLKHALTLIK